MLWPLSDHLAVSTTNEGDALQQIWSMGWASHALTSDPANLFNGNIFYPYLNTLAYSDDLLAQTFQAFPIYLLTGNLVLAYGILTLFSFVLSGWGTYLLVKEMTGSRLAGLFAGMIFAFASYKIGRLSQLNILSTQWIPFCFLFLRRMLLQDQLGHFRQQVRRGWGTALAFAIFFALNALSTFYYFFYILPLLAIYLIIFYLGARRWPGPAFLLRLVGSAIVASIFILPTLFPYLAVVNDMGAERSPREVEQFSANYRFYLGVTENNLFWGKTLSRFSGTGGERALFPGALAYLFAFLALAGPLALWGKSKIENRTSVGLRPRSKIENQEGSTVNDDSSPLADQPLIVNRQWPKATQSLIANRERWAFLIIAVFSFLMSMGLVLHLRGWDVPGPYRLFYDYFPGWVGLRAAMRYGGFVLFAVAILAGMGLAWLFERMRDEVGRMKLGTKFSSCILPTSSLKFILHPSYFILVILLFGTFWEYRADITYINPGILPNPPEVYRWLAEPAQAGVVLELPPAPDPVNPPSIRDYYSTFNWQPLVNGVSGYLPPVMLDIARLSSEFPSKDSLAALQGIGVRWLVYHLNDENTPLPPAEWQKIEARLAKTPEVRLAKDFPKDQIKVYELAPNPWIRQAYAGLPAGAGVIVSDYRANQPTLVELFEAMLRRDGHALYGSDRAGYRFLNAPPPGRPVSAGLFAADEDPALYGFSPSEASWTGNGLTFYRRKETLAAAYDLARAADPNLAAFHRVRSGFDIGLEKDQLRFNNASFGNGAAVEGDLRLTLYLSNLEPQAIKLNGATVQLPGGMAVWRSEKLLPGQKIRLEPASGQTLYLDRAELVAFDPATPGGVSLLPGAVVLKADNVQNGTHILSNFTVWTPPISDKEPGNYIMTLDIYRRPYGTHPSGHFGTYSIALDGQPRPRQVEFDFDPIARQATAKLDGAGTGVGAETFKAAGNGDWDVFVTIRRNSLANPKDFPLVGLTRLYNFSLDNDKLSGLNLLGERQLVLLPPLK